MTMLLFIRSPGDVRSAVSAVSEVLVYRQRHLPQRGTGDEVLGVLLRAELDAGLPRWPSFDGECVGGVPPYAHAMEGSSTRLPSAGDFGIRESLSISGLWSLCWIDGTTIQEAKDCSERRARILEVLVPYATYGDDNGSGGFFPVFDASESSDAIGVTLRALRRRYPRVVAGAWFVHDRQVGILGPYALS